MPPWVVEYLGVLGPVGVFAMVFGYFVLLPIARLHYEAKKLVATGRRDVAGDGDSAGLLRTRDMIRDTDARTERIEKNTEQEISHLSTLVGATTRLAEVMDRIEERQVEHDRWERERAARETPPGRKRR